MYVVFMDLEKVYDRVNMEALWQVLRMYNVGGKMLSGIKSMYVDSLACVRVKGCENEIMIDSGVRQGCIMSPWLFNIFMDAVKIGRGESGDYQASCMQMTWFFVASQRNS